MEENKFTAIKLKIKTPSKIVTGDEFKRSEHIEALQPKQSSTDHVGLELPKRFRQRKKVERRIWGSENRKMFRMQAILNDLASKYNEINEKLREMQNSIKELSRPEKKNLLLPSSFTPPKPVDSLQQLKTFENKLRNQMKLPSFKFEAELNELHKYFASKIANGSRRKKELGLVRSFLELYFDESFVKQVGWTSYEKREAFRLYPGHHAFIKDVINAHTPEMFKTVDDVKKPIFDFFRRLHEKARKTS